MLRGIEPDQARDLLAGLPVSCRRETVRLADALGRTAAADIRAAVAIPPFDRSPYDGYAFRGEDTDSASPEHPAVLRIVEEIPAGVQPTRKVGPGQAARIMTGAPVPQGANATIKYEKTTFTPAEVRLTAPVAPDTDIVRAGEDLMEYSLILAAGTRLTAPILGLIASQGIEQVEVWQRPVIAILSSGTELAQPGQPLPPAKIYNSSLPALSGYLMTIGADVRPAGVVSDDPCEIADSLLAALAGADMLITTGGASVGDYDCLLAALDQIGADILFWKTAMKPGGSILAATWQSRLILGLSGNPGAALLGFFRIGLPAVYKLCGRKQLLPPVAEVRLKNPLVKKSPQLRLLRGHLEIDDGQAWFVENDGQGNGIVSSFVGCDLLGEIPAGSPPLPAGTRIKAWRILEQP